MHNDGHWRNLVFDLFSKVADLHHAQGLRKLLQTYRKIMNVIENSFYKVQVLPIFGSNARLGDFSRKLSLHGFWESFATIVIQATGSSDSAFQARAKSLLYFTSHTLSCSMFAFHDTAGWWSHTLGSIPTTPRPCISNICCCSTCTVSPPRELARCHPLIMTEMENCPLKIGYGLGLLNLKSKIFCGLLLTVPNH